MVQTRTLIVALGVCGFSSAFAVRATDPMVNEIAGAFAAPVTLVALLSTSYTLPYGLCQPLLGPMGDGLGKVRVLRICLAVFALALALGAVAPSLDVLFVSRVLAGAAAGGVIPLALAMIGDRVPMATRQAAIGRFLTAVLIGQLVGVGLSGFLADAVSWRGGLTATVIAALAGLIAAVTVLDKRDEPAPSGFSLSESRRRYGLVLRNPSAFVCFGAVLIEGMAVYGVTPFIPEILQLRGGGTATQAGLVLIGLGIGGIVFSMNVALFIRLIGTRVLMPVGGLIAAAGLAILALVETWPAMSGAFVAIGLGFFMLHTSLQNRVTELAPQARASAVSLHAFFFFIGQASAPILFGLLLHTYGPTPSILVSAVVIAIVGATAGLLLNRLDARDRALRAA